MGYTHYWTFKPIPRGQAKLIEQRYQLAVRQCTRVIHRYNTINKILNIQTISVRLGEHHMMLLLLPVFAS